MLIRSPPSVWTVLIDQPITPFFRSRDVGDRFYLIESGAASVTKDDAGKEVFLTELKKGAYFGGQSDFTFRFCSACFSAFFLSFFSILFFCLYPFFPHSSELALLNDEPRRATVTAKGRLKCGTLDKGAFTRLLGPCITIMQRNMANYEKPPESSE